MVTRKDLLREFDKMEAERIALLESLKSYSAETLTKKPSADAWSVTEVIMHLVAAEGGALKYMRKKLEYGGHHKSKIGSAIKKRLLNFAISLPVKYKAPKVVQIQEGSDITFEDAVGRWNDVREDLKNDYSSVEEGIIGHELFKHPAAGKMNMLQGAEFMRHHMNRHIKQIKRTIDQIA